MMLSYVLLVVGALAVAVLSVRQLRWRVRRQVSRATLRQDELDGNSRLVRIVSRGVLPVRLVGIGDATCRLDLTLIRDQPDRLVGDFPARNLAALVGEKAYLVYHPVYAEIWLRTGFRSVRRVVALPRTELLNDFELILHDPDGIGAIDDHYRGSVGTIRISVTRELSLYLEVLVKPTEPRSGPGTTNSHGFSGLR